MPGNDGTLDFAAGAKFVGRMAARILETGLPAGLTLNINIPPSPHRGVKLTTLGERRYEPEVVEKTDPRSRTYYWIGLGKVRPLGGKRSDIQAAERGFISITPLHTDRTDPKALTSPALKKIVQSLV
jgi:5'-nucleotidase